MAFALGSADDSEDLRGLLARWAARFVPSPEEQEWLAEATIAAATLEPERLDNVPVDQALKRVMREIFMKASHLPSRAD
jgi:hypothetical protein